MRALNAALFVLLAAKGLRPPASGWNARTFAQQGHRLVSAQVRLAKLVQRRAAANVARLAQRLIRQQVEETVSLAQRVTRSMSAPGAKATIDIFLPSHGDVWLRVMEQVFRERGVEAELELVRPIQSVMGQGFSRTALLLGDEDTEPEDNVRLLAKSREIARRVTRVNETTQNKIRERIFEGVENQLSEREVAESILETVPSATASRATVIARTELNRAWSLGAGEAFRLNGEVSHVDVVGCEDREWDAPQFFFQGEPACNRKGVRVADIEELIDVFHPNHTGQIVASNFYGTPGNEVEEHFLPGEGRQEGP